MIIEKTCKKYKLCYIDLPKRRHFKFKYLSNIRVVLRKPQLLFFTVWKSVYKYFLVNIVNKINFLQYNCQNML